MGLLLSSTVAWMVAGNDTSWKPASNILIMLCNLNAIFLIFVLQKSKSKEHETSNEESGSDEYSSEGSNSQTSYKRDTSTPSDDEAAAAKDSLFEEHAKRLLQTVWKLQLLITVLLSVMVFWDSYNETNHFYVSLKGLLSTADWHRSLYLLSNGAFLACLLLYTLSRRFSGSLLVPTVAAVLFSIACLAVAVWLLSEHRKAELNQMQKVLAFDSQSTSSNQITSYQGQAHVRGVSLLDERPCQSYQDALRVQLNVQWGGSWGCPSSPNTYCEASIESIVSCQMWGTGKEDGSSVNQFDDNPLNYVLFRYHNYDDMSSYDDDAFDIDEAPEQNFYWNHPSESIVGNCQNCETRSLPYMMMDFHQLTRTLHQGFFSMGAGIFCVGWLVATLIQSHRQRTAAASSDGGRTLPLV